MGGISEWRAAILQPLAVSGKQGQACQPDVLMLLLLKLSTIPIPYAFTILFVIYICLPSTIDTINNFYS